MKRAFCFITLLILSTALAHGAAADGQKDGEGEFIFQETTTAAGIDYVGPSYGPAAADFDGDGFPDVAVSRHAVVRLWRNQGDGTFRAFGEFPEADTHGLAWTDLDDDGRLDLYVSVGAARGYGHGPNQWLRGRDEDSGAAVLEAAATPKRWSDPSGRGRCAVTRDFDGDGALDLLLVNAAGENSTHRLISGRSQEDSAASVGLSQIEAECLTATGPASATTWIAYGGGKSSGKAFQLDDEGRLQDVTKGLGLTGSRNVQAVAAGDFDGDGDLDLYLVSGFGIPPQIVEEAGRIRLRVISEGGEKRLRWRVPPLWTADFVVLGGRPSFVDLGDGEPIKLPAEIRTARVKAVDAGTSLPSGEGLFLRRIADDVVELTFRGSRRYRALAGEVRAAEGSLELLEVEPPLRVPPPQPNRLLENRDGRFVDVTARAGVGDEFSGRDAFFFDFDNDFDLDLLVVNGGSAFENHPDVLYRNQGDGTFERLSDWGRSEGPLGGRGFGGLAMDYDADGALDLFLTNGDGPAPGNEGRTALWRNTARVGGWARLDLCGPPGNRTAQGARVLARLPDGRRLLQERSSTTGRFSTSILPFHFGLGDAPSVSLEVLMPSGARESLVLKAGETRKLGCSPDVDETASTTSIPDP